jgi:hypothetical protein
LRGCGGRNHEESSHEDDAENLHRADDDDGGHDDQQGVVESNVQSRDPGGLFVERDKEELFVVVDHERDHSDCQDGDHAGALDGDDSNLAEQEVLDFDTDGNPVAEQRDQQRSDREAPGENDRNRDVTVGLGVFCQPFQPERCEGTDDEGDEDELLLGASETGETGDDDTNCHTGKRGVSERLADQRHLAVHEESTDEWSGDSDEYAGCDCPDRPRELEYARPEQCVETPSHRDVRVEDSGCGRTEWERRETQPVDQNKHQHCDSQQPCDRESDEFDPFPTP